MAILVSMLVSKGFTAAKKWGSSGPRPDDHCMKSLIAYPTELAWHVLVRGGSKLTFVHTPLHLLDLDDSTKIKRACLYKDRKVSSLQAHARLAQ